MMMRYRLPIIATLFCLATPCACAVSHAQVLTINTGATLTINGGTLDVNCLDILIKSGGTLDLQTGTIRDKNILTVETGGTFTNTSGTILNCGGNTFYLIHAPNKTPTIITLPKN